MTRRRNKPSGSGSGGGGGARRERAVGPPPPPPQPEPPCPATGAGLSDEAAAAGLGCCEEPVRPEPELELEPEPEPEPEPKLELELELEPEQEQEQGPAPQEKEKAQLEAEGSKRTDRSSMAGQGAEPTGEKLLEWPQLELERVNSFLTSRLQEIKNTIKESIRASFSVYDLNLDVNDFPKKAAMLEQRDLLSRLNGSSDLQEIGLDLSPLTLGSSQNHTLHSPSELDPVQDERISLPPPPAAENGLLKRLSAVPNLSRMIWVQSPKVADSAPEGLGQDLKDAVSINGPELPEPPPGGGGRQKKNKRQSSQAKKNEICTAPGHQAKLDSPPTKGQASGARQPSKGQDPPEGPRGSRSGQNWAWSAKAEKGSLWRSRKNEAKADRLEQESLQLPSPGYGPFGSPAGLGASPQTKGKHRKNRNKMEKSTTSLDDVFLPKDVDGVEMDETDREVEYFKRFCLDSAKQTRQKVAVNWTNFTLKKITSSAAQ
uniref:FAM193 C-terminal domain-containing protein n=1 Tax=Monodelphis domestica TaxID=13616 RepID=F6Y1E3_MONDO